MPTIQETTLYNDIIQHLKKEGFEAIGETKIKGNKRPDVFFSYKNDTFVVEVKLSDQKNINAKATRQAIEYAKIMGAKGYITLVYPEKIKKQGVLTAPILEDIVLNTKIEIIASTEFWFDDFSKTFKEFVQIMKEQFESQFLKPEPKVNFNTVVKHVNAYVTDLNEVIYHANQQKIATEVVEKLDLFSSIGDIKDPEAAQKQVLNLASFLLFNQILFYHIFVKRNDFTKMKPLAEIKKVKDIQQYFDAIQEIDYKSVYRINILHYIPERRESVMALNDLIVNIHNLKAEFITHDLAGRFFHDLIPFEVRKVLAAFYTHPNAADLLANLLIDDHQHHIIDPACGSGTLLVASYKRKEQIYKNYFGYNRHKEMHQRFIEEDITGIDIMPFAAHISTINLTMQNIEQITNKVRFATRDSLELASIAEKGRFKNFGIDIETYNETIQKTMFQIYEPKAIKKGAVSADGNGDNVGFNLQLADVVIMNPPYSDREKMPKEMQDKLKANQTLNKHSGNLINLWGYFLVLGDLLMKENGLCGSVIPINFARGKASEKIREFILNKHSIRAIIKPVGDLAFSEGAAFRDIILITQKTKPEDKDICKIVYVKESMRGMAEKTVQDFADTILDKDLYQSEGLDVFSVTQKELKAQQGNLMYFLWANSYESYESVATFYQDLNQNKLKPFPKGFVRDCYNSAGFKGLIDATFITNPMGDKNRIKRAFMILESEKKHHLNIRIANTDLRYKVPKKVVRKALRTITDVKTFEIGKTHDYLITDDFPDFKQIKVLSKKLKGHKKWDWKKIQKKAEGKFVNLALSRRFNMYSANTSFLAFYSEDEFAQADTFKIVPNIDKNEAKVLCLFYNSIFNLLQIFTNKENTTGAYGTIRETDLLEFQLLDVSKLSKKDWDLLLDLFDKLRSVEFPSIVEQIESRFAERVELDMTILQVLGYDKREINKLLPALYDTVLRELKQDF